MNKFNCNNTHLNHQNSLNEEVLGFVWLMVFNAIFNNIFVYIVANSFYWWRKPLTCHKSLTKLYHIMLHRVHLAMNEARTHNFSRKYNYHTITTTKSQNIVSSNPTHARCDSVQNYVIKLSVTCAKSVVFSGYSGFLHQYN